MSSRRSRDKDKGPGASATSVAVIDPRLMTAKERQMMKEALRAEEKREKAEEQRKKIERRKQAAAQSEEQYQQAQNQRQQQNSGPQRADARASKARSPTSADATDSDHSRQGPDGDDNDSAAGYDSGAEAAKRAARKNRKRKNRPSTGSSDSADDGAGLAGPDAVAKNPLPKGIAKITVGVPEALRKSGKARQRKKKKSEREDIVTSSSSEEDAQPSSNAGPHTPYKRAKVARGKKAPPLSLLSPTSKIIGEDIRTDYTAILATKDVFPKEQRALKVARQLFKKHTAPQSDQDSDSSAEDDSDNDDKRARRAERAKADAEYAAHMTHLAIGVESSFRGHVVEDAEELVAAEYNLRATSLTEDARQRQIDKLLANGAFTFKSYKTRDGAFECPILPHLLRKSFLTRVVKKGRPLALGPNLPLFADAPPPLIAFLLTAIECILRRWKSGTYEKHPFNAAKYEPIYTRHLLSLSKAEESTPGILEKIGKALWKAACEEAGINAQPQDDAEDAAGYLCPEDLEKMSSSAAPTSE